MPAKHPSHPSRVRVLKRGGIVIETSRSNSKQVASFTDACIETETCRSFHILIRFL